MFALASASVACSPPTSVGNPVGLSPDGSPTGDGGPNVTAEAPDADAEGGQDEIDGGVESGSDAGPAANSGDGGSDAGGALDAGTVIVPVNGTITSLAVSPGVLTPSFSTAIDDYYVVCASASNTLTVTVGTSADTTSETLSVAQNQAIVVGGQYWIRCLPSDFPTITVTTYPDAGSPTPGYYLVNGSNYAVVLDTNGTPVWYAHGSYVLNVSSPASDTLAAMLNAESPFGAGNQSPFVVDALGTSITTDVESPDGPTDPHELLYLSNGDVLLYTVPIETVDLTGLESFGPNSQMADCKIEEVDPGGNLVWSWLASDHVDPVLESLEPQTDEINGETIVDVFHCNSIDVDGTGNLLVSIRHANAVYYVDRATGNVVWKLGGSLYSKDAAELIEVENDPEGTFSLQHDARFQANGDISVFDDHGAGTGVARGVQYDVDPGSATATPDWQFLGISASEAEGSFRRYADGESVIGWGLNTSDNRVVTEINAAGADVLDIAFGGSNATYRAVKVPLTQLDIQQLRASAGR